MIGISSLKISTGVTFQLSTLFKYYIPDILQHQMCSGEHRAKLSLTHSDANHASIYDKKDVVIKLRGPHRVRMEVEEEEHI